MMSATASGAAAYASRSGRLQVRRPDGERPSPDSGDLRAEGLRTTISALSRNGNSVVVVEHEREIIRSADWVIELGPEAGAKGGTVIAEGAPAQLETDPRSIMGPFLAGAAAVPRDRPPRAAPAGQIAVEIGDLYNLHGVTAAFPVRRLTALAGPSGAGKTALVLDSLIPAARALLSGSALPAHVRRLDLGGIRQACTRSTLPRSSACSTGCWRPGPPSSSSTTTWTSSPPPTISSTWGRAAALTAATSSPRAHPRTWRAHRPARPAPGWPSTWACRRAGRRGRRSRR